MGGWRVAPAAKWTALVVAAALLACLSPGPAHADDSSIGTSGGGVHPIWNTGVRLAAETVQATCFGDFAEYRVDFEFTNDGPARTVKLGFPFASTVSGHEGPTPPAGFQAWQDGHPLTVTTVASNWFKGRAGYFVHTARFRHGTTMITVSYLGYPSGSVLPRLRGAADGDLSGGTNAAYEYWLHTGATWKGTIGAAVVRYRLADTFRGTGIDLPSWDVAAQGYVTTPSGWTTPLPRTYQWRFNDFEPTTAAHADTWWRSQHDYDVTLAYSQPVTAAPTVPKRWTASSTAGRDNADFSPDSTWAEGAPGLGIGEWLQGTFGRPVHLRELRIVPGDTLYGSAFDRYARPRTLRAVFSNGTSKLLHFRDAPSLQRFPVDVTTRWVRLVIRSAYPGADYPATCISTVDFGTQRAPGYAPFRSLISDPTATGSLPAWAGPPAPAPRASLGGSAARNALLSDESTSPDEQAMRDYEGYAGGDLLGVSTWEDDQGFPADAPFKEPSSLAALKAMDPTLRLPAPALVGRVTAVQALSYQTFEVTYSGGVELLVNARAGDWPVGSLAAIRKDEKQLMDDYSDGRTYPFDIVRIGRQKVGLAQPGDVPGTAHMPGELFWYASGVSYHLYAPVSWSTTRTIVAAARSMVLPTAVHPAPRPRPKSTGTPWWPPAVGAGVFAVMVAAVLAGARRRRHPAALPEAGR